MFAEGLRGTPRAVWITWSLAIASVVVLAMSWPGAAAAQRPRTGDDLKKVEQERTDAYAVQLEAYLRKWLVEEYPRRAERAWKRNYRSVEVFLKSVEANRQRWRKVVRPPELQQAGALQRRPHPPLAKRNGEWLTLPLGGLTAEGLLVLPVHASPQSPVPLVIAQH